MEKRHEIDLEQGHILDPQILNAKKNISRQNHSLTSPQRIDITRRESEGDDPKATPKCEKKSLKTFSASLSFDCCPPFLGNKDFSFNRSFDEL